MIEGLKDLIEMYEKAFPGKWGRCVATTLLVAATVAAFVFSVHATFEYGLIPAFHGALWLIEAWPRLDIKGIVSTETVAGIAVGIIMGAVYLFTFPVIHRLVVSAQLRRLHHRRLRFSRDYLSKRSELMGLIANVRENDDAALQMSDEMKKQEQSDYEDLKRRWGELDRAHANLRAEHAENKQMIRDLMDQFDVALTKLKEEAAKLPTSPAEAPERSSPSGTEKGTRP